MTQIILSSNQIHRLHHAFFVPQGEIKATLLIVHGMSEHGGRYAKFAQFLADNGVLVATYDQLGHGSPPAQFPIISWGILWGHLLCERY